MSFLGGFYLYRVDPNTITIADASDDKPQSADITGVILFKDIGVNGKSQIIFGYFPIPQTVMKPGGKNPSQLELVMFNPINEFINTRNFDTPNDDKGIYYYTPTNLEEFLRKCYIPPISPSLEIVPA
jgi:hypothetical protein